MSFYWTLLQYAWRDTAAFVRGHFGAELFIALGAVLLPAVVSFAIHESFVSVLRTVGFSLGALAVAVLLVFGWNAIWAPSRILDGAHQEASALRRRLSERLGLDVPRMNPRDLGNIAFLRGWEIKEEIRRRREDPPIDDARRWSFQIREIVASVDSSQVEKLEDPEGLNIEAPKLESHEQREWWEFMEVRLRRLREFIDSLDDFVA